MNDPATFGNYRAIKLLGEGGMGSVYLAEHPQIGRQVAVKVLRPELASDAQALGRFLNEARAANAIRHPNIIEIIDSGTTPAGQAYLVMELLEGEALSARIARLGTLPLRDTVDFARQAASALAAAHGKGIVHRDLKPDNLFIVRDPEGAWEKVKVLDFGIAKLQVAPGEVVKTRTGTMLGTPLYMSPEQCLGTRQVDHRTDIYAMGCIVFEMLAGKPPFVSEGFGELVHMHLNVPPPSLRTVSPQVPEAVEAVVLKALAKAPEARFSSMVELRDALTAAAGAEAEGLRPTASIGREGPATAPTLTVPTPVPRAQITTLSASTGAREEVRAPRRTGRWIAGAAVAVAVAAGALWLSRSDRRQASDPPVAAKPSQAEQPAAQERPPKVDPPAAPRAQISTTPEGAKVVRVADGKVLGKTPLAIPLAARDEKVEVGLELAGYVPTRVTVNAETPAEVTLARVPAKKRPPRKPRSTVDEPAKL